MLGSTATTWMRQRHFFLADDGGKGKSQCHATFSRFLVEGS
jgi:hypothetical protein